MEVFKILEEAGLFEKSGAHIERSFFGAVSTALRRSYPEGVAEDSSFDPMQHAVE